MNTTPRRPTPSARNAPWSARLQARLAPPEPVRLLHPDGTPSVWAGRNRLVAAPADAARARHVAVQLPDDLVLHRALALPPLADANLRDAVALEAEGASPFAATDLVWGFDAGESAGPQRQVHLALASRRQVEAFLAERWPELLRQPPGPEVWALVDGRIPVVLAGFGESDRLQSTSRQRRWQLWLLVSAVVLATASAVSPTLQLRVRADEAQQAYEKVAARAGPLVRKRDELTAVGDKLRLLDLAMADRADAAGAMEYLTQALPDDAYVFSLEVRGTRVTVTGNTTDAAALLQRLSADPRLKDVRSPTAVTRQPGAAKETFTIEFTLERLANGPAVAAAAGAAGAMPATTAGVSIPLGTPSGRVGPDGTTTAPAPTASGPSAVAPAAAVAPPVAQRGGALGPLPPGANAGMFNAPLPTPPKQGAAPARAGSAAASPFSIGGSQR